MQETCSTDCMSCEYGKQLAKRCLEECESAIDAAYDFHALTTICKNQHIKNKEGKETTKEDAPTATLQEKNDAIIQTINQIYDGWMKNPRSAMISCNDGFRPVSFLIEVIEE